MKKKKYKDGLLSPDEYWEKKLGISFNSEFLRYKKLCNKITKKDYRSLDGFYFISYCDWKQYVEDMISRLDSDELINYYHFLESRKRKESFLNSISSKIYIPYMIAFFAPLIVDKLFNSFYNNTVFQTTFISVITHFIIYIVIMISIIGLTLYIIYNLAHPLNDSELRKNFYEDMKKIIEFKWNLNKIP